MFIPIVEIITVFAILNATLAEQEVPIEVQITPVPTEGEDVIMTGSGAAEAAPIPGTTPPGTMDIAAITALVTAVGGIVTGVVVQKRSNSSNDNAIADTVTNLKESLKKTDQGSAENAKLLARVTEQAASVSPELATALQNCKPAAQQNAKEWDQDMKAYYENFKPSGPEDRNLNNTKAKLAVVNKETTPVDLLEDDDD